ncbi:hypothetical protein ABZ860_00695 [Microbispora sp. NPDC046973]|uniref:hypothetical protein n=1 Tax=Microbispora sp. NPDC046973 TaxID=3155022 RepID=UPI0033C82653
MRSERDLAAVLRRAADDAPDPADLLAGLGERRRRRTRQRYRTALAAAGVVAVAVGGTAVVRGGHVATAVGNRPSATSTATAESTVTATATTTATATATATSTGPVKPAREVWPEAVFTLPKKAADGSAYRPVTALSPTEILVTAESSFEKAGRVEIYDLANNTSRVLTEMVPQGKGYYEQSVEAGSGHVAWYGTRPNTDDKWADFWVAPIQGGPAVRVGEVTGALSEVETIGVSADHVVWSPRSGGVYRIPIGGGEAEKMPDTDGMWLLAWPWAADVHVGVYAADTSDRNQRLLVNLETGERRPVTAAAGVHRLRCAVEWCVGRSGEHLVAQRLDGSVTRELSGGMSDQHIFGGRFVMVGREMYDISTGRAALVAAADEDGKTSSYGQGISSSPPSVFYWNSLPLKSRKVCRDGEQACAVTPTQPGDTFTVLNLAAVPAE